MGKASRSKRDRREEQAAQPAGGGSPERRQLPVFWLTIGALVAAGIVALVVTAPDDKDKAANAAADKVPAYADVTVEGASLPTWTGSGDDEAEGATVPSINAEKFDGMRTTLGPDDGVARAWVVVAHWCPHCQAEVPRIVEWSAENELPEGVEIVALSTSVSDGQPNYPPAAWLAKEDWPYDTLIDDEAGTGAEALGVEGFPFLVFVGADGKVQQRFSGEMPIKEFDAAIQDLAKTVPADAATTPADAPAG